MLVLVLDNNADQQVYKASLVGLSKLILHGQYCTRELMSKFLLSYFNPATDPEINQILGIFFESIIRMKKQESLHDALIPTLVTLFEAPADSPLREVKTETVLKYVIGATRPVFCSNGLNLHNTLGLKLLEFMSDNLENREIHRVFAKELLLLEIGDDPLLKKDMVVKIEALLAGISVDLRTKKKISDFRDMLKGCYKKALKFSSTAMENLDGEPEIVESEDEEKVAEEEKFTADDIMDISSSGVVMKDVQINVTKLELSGIQKDEEMTEPGEVSDGSKVSEVLETSEILANQTQVPATQDPAASSTQNDSNLNDSVDLPATQSYDSEPSSEDEEINVTVKSVAPTFTESEEIIPATPETPVRAKRIITNKRHLDVSKSINSPLRKQSKSDEPTIVTPKTPKTSSTMIASPKTPRFSTLPQSKSSTPNTDRQTRKQAREEIAQTSKLTRSTSKKMNVDPVEIAEKAEEMAKTIQATKSATKIEKAASVKQKAAAEKANPTIEITAPSNEKTAPAKRLTRKAAAAKISQGKESKPRWR